MSRPARASCLALIVGLTGSPAFAQSPAADAGKLEVSVGILRIGREAFRGRDAQETTGSSAGSPFRLFSSSSELTAVSEVAARAAVHVFRSLDAEVSGTYSTPELQTRIDSDVETSNAPILATVAVQQFTVGGAGVWYLPAPQLGARTRLFVRGGLGLERHVEDRGRRVIDGPVFEAGGGIKFVLASRARGSWRAIGARLDALALVRSRSITLDNRAHASPGVGASVYLRF